MKILTARGQRKCFCCRLPIFKGDMFLASGEAHGNTTVGICAVCVDNLTKVLKDKGSRRGYVAVFNLDYTQVCSICGETIYKGDVALMIKYHHFVFHHQMRKMVQTTDKPTIEWACSHCVTKANSELQATVEHEQFRRLEKGLMLLR